MMTSYEFLAIILDKAMIPFAAELQAHIQLAPAQTARFATTLVRELQSLPNQSRIPVAEQLNRPVPIRDRLLELSAFEEVMSNSENLSAIPALVRSQVITQNYICFVYLRDSLFRVLQPIAPNGSTLARTLEQLTHPRVNALRNAIAHGNWRYNANYTGIEYWSETHFNSGIYRQYSVDQRILTFWQALCRCTAHSALLVLQPYATPNKPNLGNHLLFEPEVGFQLTDGQKSRLSPALNTRTVEAFLSWLRPEVRSEALEMFDASEWDQAGEIHLIVSHPDLEQIVNQINQQRKLYIARRVLEIERAKDDPDADEVLRWLSEKEGEASENV
jgi:hypothetical protein